MQIKTTRRQHFTLIWMPIIKQTKYKNKTKTKKPGITSVGMDVEKLESLTFLVKIQNDAATMKNNLNNLALLQKVKHRITT